MRLSDIKGEQVIDTIADLIGPISRIARDEAVREVLKPVEVPEGGDKAERVTARLTEALPGILKGHREDLVAILAAVNGKSPGEYAEGMTLASLISDAADLITDEAFAGFLASRAGMSSTMR